MKTAMIGIALLSALLPAQSPAPASLSIALDRESATASLHLPSIPESWEPFRASLGAMLSCPPSRFNNPKQVPPASITKSLSKELATQLSKGMAEINARSLIGSCPTPLRSSHGIVQGSLDINPLVTALAGLQDERPDELTVMVDLLERAPVRDYHIDGVKLESYKEDDDVTTYYSIPIHQGSKIAPLQITFGFPVRVLLGPSLIAVAFVIVPIAVIVWMRRAALRSGHEDPCAAWFSYQRTAGQCLFLVMLLWAYSDFHARQDATRFFVFLLGNESPWIPVLISAAIVVPILVVYSAKVILSYAVFCRFRGEGMTFREFADLEFVMSGIILLPVVFIYAGFSVLDDYGTPGTLILAAAAIALFFGVSWRARVMKPQALSTGELRDRIFDLAKRASVKVTQLFVLSASKGQIANAAAAQNNMVIFTDYLLDKMSKREVDFVAAHELTHLRHRHPLKLGLTMIAAISSPFWFHRAIALIANFSLAVGGWLRPDQPLEWPLRWVRASEWIGDWNFYGATAIFVGLGMFYTLSRRFEYTADAGAIALTGDPEAGMTSLFKLNQLNLTPLQWGKLSGVWITHPSTQQRIDAIAGRAGIAPERTKELLHSDPETGPLDRYAIPAAPEQEALTDAGQGSRMRKAAIILLVFQWMPAYAIGLLIERMLWEGFAAYFIGAVVNLAAYILLRRWLAFRPRWEIRDRLRDWARQQGVSWEVRDVVTAGVAPGDVLRFYVTSFNWDTGLLFFSRDTLYFAGPQFRWALRRDQVEELREGPGQPDWRLWSRVYIRWSDPVSGRQGLLNIASAEPCRFGGEREAVKNFGRRLVEWKQGEIAAPAVPELDSLGPPEIGEVTSLPVSKLRRTAALTFFVGFWGMAIASLLVRPDAGETYIYLFMVLLIMTIFEGFPYWRYRDRAVFSNAPSRK